VIGNGRNTAELKVVATSHSCSQNNGMLKARTVNAEPVATTLRS